MAIRILNPLVLLAGLTGLTGCEKWADGVVSEIEFPEHQSTTAASCILTTGDSTAILSVTNTASLLSVSPVDMPDGVSATIEHNGVVVLSWETADVGLITVNGGFTSAQDVLLLALDTPLSLPVGDLELKVNIPGEEPLTASATQPGIPEVASEFVLGADTLTEPWGEKITDELHLTLINRSGVRDAFSLHLEEGYVAENDTVWYPVYGNNERFEDPRLDFVSSCACWMVDDQNVDGQVLDDLVLTRIRWDEGYGYGYYETPSVLRLMVDQLSPSLADFYRSVETHQAAQDNPFANPSGIYSNTSTGYGHFGLAARRTVLIQ